MRGKVTACALLKSESRNKKIVNIYIYIRE